jgi:nicotinamide mononucleotide (NMN) deamidase PncC
MDWNNWGTGGFTFFVSNIFNSSRSYAFRGGVGLDGVTDRALVGCIFIGCRAHLQAQTKPNTFIHRSSASATARSANVQIHNLENR